VMNSSDFEVEYPLELGQSILSSSGKGSSGAKNTRQSGSIVTMQYKYAYNFIPTNGGGTCQQKKGSSVTVSLWSDDSKDKSYPFHGKKNAEDKDKYVLFFYPKEKKFVLERPSLQISDLDYKPDLSAAQPAKKTGRLLVPEKTEAEKTVEKRDVPDKVVKSTSSETTKKERPPTPPRARNSEESKLSHVANKAPRKSVPQPKKDEEESEESDYSDESEDDDDHDDHKAEKKSNDAMDELDSMFSK